MAPTVDQAIKEIRDAFPGHLVEVEPDGQEGAWVTVHGLVVGEQYEPSTTWMTFRITFQYPFADVYPHYCALGLKRKDGQHPGEWFHVQQPLQTPSKSFPAVMISRRSNRLNPSTDTATFKLHKVLDWMRSR